MPASWLGKSVNLCLKAAAIGLSLYPLLDPGSSHFSGKAMGARAVLYPAALALIPAIWFARGRPRPYPHRMDAVYAIPFLVDAAGNVFGLFGAVPRYDLFAHYLNWACFTTVFGAAIGPTQRSRLVLVGLVVGFGATTHLLWEIGEFVLMKSGSSGLQLTYENTMLDFASSFLGTLTGAALAGIRYRRAPAGRRGPFGWPEAIG